MKTLNCCVGILFLFGCSQSNQNWTVDQVKDRLPEIEAAAQVLTYSYLQNQPDSTRQMVNKTAKELNQVLTGNVVINEKNVQILVDVAMQKINITDVLLRDRIKNIVQPVLIAELKKYEGRINQSITDFNERNAVLRALLMAACTGIEKGSMPRVT